MPDAMSPIPGVIRSISMVRNLRVVEDGAYLLTSSSVLHAKVRGWSLLNYWLSAHPQTLSGDESLDCNDEDRGDPITLGLMKPKRKCSVQIGWQSRAQPAGSRSSTIWDMVRLLTVPPAMRTNGSLAGA